MLKSENEMKKKSKNSLEKIRRVADDTPTVD